MTRVGPAGWAYKDWRGVVYPHKRSRAFHELAFLAEYFDTVEINVSFYRPLTATEATAWVRLVEENLRFQFTAKLLRVFTHATGASTNDEQLVKSGFGPLLEAGRLGAVLLQFPWSFRNTPENRTYVARLRDTFVDYPAVLEVRHASWAIPETLPWLEGMQMGLCNIDQPLFSNSISPGALTTAPVGYVRLHGRNYKSWFAQNKFPGERYNYLYTPDELDPWVDRIREVSAATTDTYVVTNNHYLGKAVVNATEISAVLKGEPVRAPASLVEHYPELAEFVRRDEIGQLPLLS